MTNKAHSPISADEPELEVDRFKAVLSFMMLFPEILYVGGDQKICEISDGEKVSGIDEIARLNCNEAPSENMNATDGHWPASGRYT